ncbi:MAG: N-6 DNA methylase [Actinobacteria bacterium]|nr:N-6 DNA methylase [Actinomycetota bacterium]
MAEETLVTAADIARLAGVGRSAVSNWRRRYAGFPRPVAGTPASPLFALIEVETWLHRQGRLLDVPLVEQAWQELRAHTGDDLRLASALADVGERMASGQRVKPQALAELVTAMGPSDTFEVLLSRFHESRARTSAVPAAEIAELMATLTKGADTVLDPACGTGELLLVAQENGSRRLLGQEADADLARLAGIRLRLGTSIRDESSPAGEAIVETANAVFHDAFPGIVADAVLCYAPSYPRAEGKDLNSADPRWVYGVPPRMEPELAWVQHALAHLSPTGLAVVLLPRAAAARRPGRRIRAQLLRKGALRAIIALPAANQTNQLWLLRRPADQVPASVLMMAAADPAAIVATWRRFTGDRYNEEPAVSRAVPVIDLLDDEVDLNPARYLSAPPAELTAERFVKTREGVATVVHRLARLIPDLRPADRPRPTTFVTVAELARTGQLEVYQAPVRADSGDGSAPLLTAQDVIEGRPPSGIGQPGERWITLRSGDIVVASGADRLSARVVTSQGVILGAGLTMLRVNPEQLDAHYVAGALRSSANGRVATRQLGSSGRADVSRAQIAQLPLPEQLAFGDALRRLDELESAARSATSMGASLAQLLADAIAAGTLQPPAGQTNAP